MRETSSVLHVFQRPGYPLYLVTATLSRITGTMFSVAVFLLFLERTDNPATAALIVAAGTIPAALSGALLGAWLDSVAHPRLLIAIDQGTSVLALAGLLIGAGELPTLACAALAVAYGATRPWSIGGFTRAIPELVTTEQLPAANVLESVSFNTAFIIGPLLSATLAAAGGADLAVLIEVLLTAVATVLVLATTVLDRRPSASSIPSFRRAWVQGWTVLRDRRDVTASVVIATLWTGLSGFYVVLFPLLSAATLGSPDHGGLMWALSATGSILGAFASRRIVQADFSRPALSLLLLLSSGCTICWLASSPVVLGATILGAAAGAAPLMLLCAQIRLARTPPPARGSIFTILGSLNLGASAVGTVIAGSLAAEWGAAAATLMLGAFTATLALVAWTALRRHQPPTTSARGTD
ncbi:MFS transporter [Desertihabitans aurantiacus]|uniref:MFS transporter n=1 Tax=Desertihabitans aurantiacus TaxID=2282477 RepID=UPI0013002A6D|nr:MFS transporter [Desertihabitans aurantiacus]